MKKFLILLIIILILSACSTSGEMQELPEIPGISDTQSESEYDYESLARTMGYTDEHLFMLEACINEGLPEKAVLNPLKYSKSFGESYTTSDGKYTLGTFFFDPDVYADYGGPIGFAYVSTGDSIKIVPETLYHLHSYGTVDDSTFAFQSSDGIRFYRFDDFSKPAQVWNPKTDNSEFGLTIISAYTLPEHKLFAAFIADLPDYYSGTYNGIRTYPDITYKLCLLDSDANVTETDTGICLMTEAQGMPDVVRPKFLFSDSGKIRFKINSEYYEYHFETNEVTVFDQNAYLEKVDPVILRYADWFDGCLEYLICEPSARTFTKEQMAAYTYHTSVDHNGRLSKELYSENSEKFFGIDLLEYETLYKVDGSGCIVPKEGYSPSPSMFVLKELYERSDGSKKAVFYWVGTDYYEPDYIDSKFGGTLPYELIYNGKFSGAARFVELIEVIFFEHDDYIEPVSVYNIGTLPASYDGYIYKSNRSSDDFLEFDIPDLTGAKCKKLPYVGGDDVFWCVNNEIVPHVGWDFTSTYTKVMEYANSVYNVTDHRFGAITNHSFLGLDEADYYSLLYSAVYAAPESHYVYEEEDSVYKRLSEACGYDFLAVVYGEDVEKTFRYLFGDDIEYVPANLEEYAYRYIPEADIYITYSEYTKAGSSHPVVIDYGPANNDRTLISVIFASLLPDGTLSVYLDGEDKALTKDNFEEFIPLLPIYNYIFEPDNTLYGIEIKTP